MSYTLAEAIVILKMREFDGKASTTFKALEAAAKTAAAGFIQFSKAAKRAGMSPPSHGKRKFCKLAAIR